MINNVSVIFHISINVLERVSVLNFKIKLFRLLQNSAGRFLTACTAVVYSGMKQSV